MSSLKIKDQLQLLKENPHIIQMEPRHQYLYLLTYTPTETTSLYRDRNFLLQLQLSENYPEHPPSLRFIDPIYHLNVDKSNGYISMGILLQEWSPYLTINSLIENLDGLMEEPDAKYPASPEMLELYEKNKEKYLQKVLANFQNSELDNFQVQEEQQSPIRKIRNQERKEEEWDLNQEKRTGKGMNRQIQNQRQKQENKQSKRESCNGSEHESMKTTRSKIVDMISLSVISLTQLEESMNKTDNEKVKTILKQSYISKLRQLKKLRGMEEGIRDKMITQIEDEIKLFGI